MSKPTFGLLCAIFCGVNTTFYVVTDQAIFLGLTVTLALLTTWYMIDTAGE